MSKEFDKDFIERFRRAAKHARLEFSPSRLAGAFGYAKQTIHTWMAGSIPRTDALFRIADKMKVEPRWLATGQEPMLTAVNTTGIEPAEQELLARYRAADPRWQLSLRLLAALATEDQIEAATDVNMVIARIFGKKVSELRFVSNERVQAAFGNTPRTRSK